MSRINIPVRAIVTEPNFVSEAAVRSMLADADPVYTSIGVTFGLELPVEEDFDPALKPDGGTGGPPLNFELARQARAVRYPGRLVVFFRPGTGAYSSLWADYVVMAGTSGADFAHEVGHFLHLDHTHGGLIGKLYETNRDKGYEEAKKVAIDEIRKAGGLSVFDGDLPAVKDTPPDPGPPLFQPSGYNQDGSAKNPTEHCTGTLTLVVDRESYVLSPDRRNIMSYFKDCAGSHNISPDQGRVIQRAITSGNRRHLVDGVSPESPAAVLTLDGHIHVFARGDDRNIWHSFWNGRTWSGWRADLGAGTLTSGPGAIVTADGHIHVFARGDDRNIWHSFWNGRTWSGWRADLAARTFMSGLAAVVSGDQALHTFAQGDDRNIWHSFWDGRTWSEWRADLGDGTFQP